MRKMTACKIVKNAEGRNRLFLSGNFKHTEFAAVELA